MKARSRSLDPAIREALGSRMVLLGGPRQVGKPTLALALIGLRAEEGHPACFSWDDPRAAGRIRRMELPPGAALRTGRANASDLAARSDGAGRPLAHDPRESLRLLSDRVLRSTAHPSRQEIAEALSLRLVDGSGERAPFGNLAASQLLEHCHGLEDRDGHRMELRILRDTDRREVDFVVLQERKPLFSVECKTGERSVSPAIGYFAERTPIPRFYQVHLGERHYESGAATVIPFARFCEELDLP